MLLYIGSYTQPPAGKALGIHALRLDHATGALTQLGVAAGINNPSYVALDPARRFLYAVNELHPAGTVSAFAVAPVSGELTFLNRRPTHGADPCHIAVDRQRRHVFVANYSSGSVCVLPVREDGSLGEASDFIQHVGAGIHPQRQTGPHVHSVTLDQIGRFAYVADLGLDKLFIYRVDTKRGMLEANSTPWIKLRPGSGPRHLALHTRGFAYLVNELDSTVRAMALNRTTGGLREVQTVSTLPDGITGPNTCADIHVFGSFVYASNRGHDSIASFRIAPRTGRLTPLEHVATQGRTPRGFGIDPTGKFLVVANQNSDCVVSFRIDRRTGGLQPTGHAAEVATPTCVKFAA